MDRELISEYNDVKANREKKKIEIYGIGTE